MKKISYASCAVVLVLSLVVPIVADTIRLKDGSVIRGQVIGFKDQQFTILIGAGAKGRRSRTSIYVEDIESIEFDSATTAAAGSLANEDISSGNPDPVSQPPRTNPQPDPTTAVRDQPTRALHRRSLQSRLPFAPTTRITVGPTAVWWFARDNVYASALRDVSHWAGEGSQPPSACRPFRTTKN